MERSFGKLSGITLRLAVFLLALLFLAPQSLAAPTEPTVELTHSGEGNRVVLECTGKVAPPDGENDSRVAMTLTLQAGKALTLDPSSVQAIYQSEDGEATTLSGDQWAVDQSEGLLVVSLEVDTDMGGQILCRISGRLAADSQNKVTNKAQLEVEYQDLETGTITTHRADGQDSLTLAYSLVLDLNGGSLSGKTSDYVWRDNLSAGQQVSLSDLPKPTRSGYFFDGWTLTSGSGAKLEGNALTMGSGNAALRAVWTSMADKLTLDLNGGSGRQVVLEGVTGEDVTLPDPATVLYSRDGYKLGGWSTTPDGENGTIYRGGESFTLTRGEDILYAWWAPQYTLSYDANGGTGAMPRRIFAASDQAVISENAFSRTGYKFTGWCLTADGRGSLYQSGDTLTLTGDTVLYAQWEKVYDTPAEDQNNSGGGSHLPLLLGILAALVIVGGVCGYLAWKRRRDDDGPYDDDYDGDDYDRDDRYDEYDDRYDDYHRRDRQDRYEDRYDTRRDQYDDGRDRYDNRRDRYDDRRDRYQDRRNRDRYDD